eukprot:CAMPEP_0182860140 /NCGR_PEP_ID=MMETSP0034_2-20130328/4743_1 /TAXON_ID=156128 /ORGANISM="Nephroselmis pyriformis, Strain CCMP717" /LENGTH=97 /DNA_ID=CAMNT_0024991893 /DNA_START=285 /DNA_END=575 /DNA_ORIENTATION=-
MFTGSFLCENGVARDSPSPERGRNVARRDPHARMGVLPGAERRASTPCRRDGAQARSMDMEASDFGVVISMRTMRPPHGRHPQSLSQRLTTLSASSS